MKHLIFFLFLTLFIIFLAKIYLRPFSITEDLAVNPTYLKKLEVNPSDLIFFSLIRYNKTQTKFLTAMNNQELLGIKCSDNFIRTNQGAYILKNEKTSQRYKRTVKNRGFIEYLRSKEKTLPRGKKILAARICETENKNLLVFYSIGKYQSKNVDNSTIVQTLINSTENEAIVEIFPFGQRLGSRQINIATSNRHILCDEPFQVTTGNLLYTLCSEEKNKASNYYLYQVDLTEGKVDLKSQCLNDYSSKLRTLCD